MDVTGKGVIVALTALLALGTAHAAERRTQTRDGSVQVVDSQGLTRTVKVNPSTVTTLKDDVVITPDLIYADAFTPVVVDENNEGPEDAPAAPYTYAIVLNNGDVLTKAGAGATFLYWGKLNSFREKYYYKSFDLLDVHAGFFAEVGIPATGEDVAAGYSANGTTGGDWNVQGGGFTDVPSGCEGGDTITGRETGNVGFLLQMREAAESARREFRMTSTGCPGEEVSIRLGANDLIVRPYWWIGESVLFNNTAATNKDGIAKMTKIPRLISNGTFIPWLDEYYGDFDFGTTPTYGSPQNFYMATQETAATRVDSGALTGTFTTTDMTDIRARILYTGSRNYGVVYCLEGFRPDGTRQSFFAGHTSPLEDNTRNAIPVALCDDQIDEIANGEGQWVVSNTLSALLGYQVNADTTSVWRVPKTQSNVGKFAEIVSGSETVTLSTYDMSGRTPMYMQTEIRVKPEPNP